MNILFSFRKGYIKHIFKRRIARGRGTFFIVAIVYDHGHENNRFSCDFISQGEFTDNGTETKWEEDGNLFTLSAHNSGNKHDGLLHKLTINGAEIPESTSTE